MYFYQSSAQEKLANYYRLLLSDPSKLINKSMKLEEQRNEIHAIENNWNQHEETLLDLNTIPSTKEGFIEWYLHMEEQMNIDIDNFIQFLKFETSDIQIAYYICMEELIDGSFDDLMAMVQVGMSPQPKLCAANNYWDEMGHGKQKFMHTEMFKTSSSYMRNLLKENHISLNSSPPAVCLMNGNLLLMWATRREYNMRLIGAMGLIEGSAPIRFAATTYSMNRHRFPKEVIDYHRAHIGIDTKHSKEWLQHVLKHYATFSESTILELARGVLIRYRIAIEYYTFLLQHLPSIATCKKAS